MYLPALIESDLRSFRKSENNEVRHSFRKTEQTYNKKDMPISLE